MGEVIPFGRPGKKAAAAEPSPARQVAREQHADSRLAYQQAVRGQHADRLIASGRVVPARISLAMNLGAHGGPAVDLACGTYETNPDGDVDDWEAGDAVPSREQVEKMAAFTGFEVVWFYRPMPAGPLLERDGEPGFIWMCGPGGCSAVPSDWVDERGVLHYGTEGERKPRRIVQGALPIDPGPAAEPPQPPARKAAPRKKTSPEKENPPGLLPVRPATTMPDHLKGPLLEHLAARKKT